MVHKIPPSPLCQRGARGDLGLSVHSTPKDSRHHVHLYKSFTIMRLYMVRIWKAETVLRLIGRCAGAFLVLGILSYTSIDAGGAALKPRFNVGYQVLDLKYQKAGDEKTLTVAVRYPTVAQPKLHNYGGPTNGKVAVGGVARAEGGPFPLLLFSHGYGGGGLGAVFFTEALAARGWIVACPDHHDKHSAIRAAEPRRWGAARGS